MTFPVDGCPKVTVEIRLPRQPCSSPDGYTFDNLYLVVDQQNRWKSELLPVPASALLDPLLIGEKRESSRSSYFLIDQFDLTKAEDYLIAEFLINPED
jgi:hypothetical protein